MLTLPRRYGLPRYARNDNILMMIKLVCKDKPFCTPYARWKAHGYWAAGHLIQIKRGTSPMMANLARKFDAKNKQIL